MGLTEPRRGARADEAELLGLAQLGDHPARLPDQLGPGQFALADAVRHRVLRHRVHGHRRRAGSTWPGSAWSG